MGDSTLLFWASLWLATAVVVWLRYWKRGRGAGLVFAYVLAFGASYWLAPAIYLLPWFDDASWHDVSVIGLRCSAIAFVALAVGVEMGAKRLPRLGRWRATRPVAGGANSLLAIGGVLYFVMIPLSVTISSLTAIVSTGSMLIVGAFVMQCWNAWRRRDERRLWRWLMLSAALPVCTVIGQGFIGYGFASMLTIFAFAATVYRPRWKVMVVGIFGLYLGLSAFVTYMSGRGDIRDVVWNGGSMGDRLAQVRQTVSEGELFDIRRDADLQCIDNRLNQDRLVGEAVEHLASGIVGFAHGSTVTNALFAVIPRAVWPDKPVTAGSGQLVSIYTGLDFSRDTSVGIGPVMESYINFGLPGVIAGFLIIGAVLGYVDGRAGDALREGGARPFLLWYAPGLALLMVGGSFSEITSTAAAAWLLARVVGEFVLPRERRPAPARAPQVSSPTPHAPRP